MVEKVSGFRTSGGQIIEDEESALIAEAMEEIISEMPELRLIADKVQSRLRRLCLHLQPLAGYYAKNHPRVLGETTLEPALPEKPGVQSARWDPDKAEWVDITFRPFGGCEAIQFSDQVSCDPCKLTWDVNDGDPPACIKLRKSVPLGSITSFQPSEKPKWDGCGPARTVAEMMAGAEDTICDCSAPMNGDSNHSPCCITQERKRANPVADGDEVPPVDYI